MQHQAAIAEIFPSLIPTIDRINRYAADLWELDTSMPSAIEKLNPSKLK
jgi:hypothetical protein